MMRDGNKALMKESSTLRRNIGTIKSRGYDWNSSDSIVGMANLF